MPNIYFDPQTSKSTRTGASIAAIKHASTRFLIGHCLFICDDPRAIIPAARRKWLAMARLYDKKRSMTFDADRSVKYTYLQLQMQLVRFTSTASRETNLRTVFMFCTPTTLPESGEFASIYNLTNEPIETSLEPLASPHGANYISYAQETPDARWLSRNDLEAEAQVHWASVVDFLAAHKIDLNRLITSVGPEKDLLLDKSLDTLLSVSETFLTLVTDFRRAYEQARPIMVGNDIAAQHDLTLLLAYRVQCLSTPHDFAHFLEIYEERDSLALLHDSYAPPSRNLLATSRQRLIDRHSKAGNHNIAEALRRGAHRFEAACRHCLLEFVVDR